MERSARRGVGACGIFLLAVLVSACGTSQVSSKPTATTYVGSSKDTAVLLTLHEAGEGIDATLEVAQGSSGPENTTTSSATLVGTLRDGSLDLHGTNGGQARVTGTLKSKTLTATVSLRANQLVFQLPLVKSSSSTFHSAVARIASVVQRQKRSPDARGVAAAHDANELSSAMATLDKAARALTSDAAALRATYTADERDVDAALAASTSESSAIKQEPPPSREAVCAQVASLKARVTTVANNDEFLAGFISGLVMSEGDVAKEIRSVKSAEAELKKLLAEGSLWVGVVLPTSASVTATLANGATAIGTASRATASVVSAAQVSLDKVFAASNAVITAAGCGAPVRLPSPFSLPQHA